MKILSLIVIVFLNFACDQRQNQSEPKKIIQPAQRSGFREFRIDETKTAFMISLSGVVMGTPDYQTVWSVIEAAQLNGLIDNMTEVGIMIEGGISECIEVQNAENRKQLLGDLIKVPTSLSESNYSIKSVCNCSTIKSD